MAFFFFFPVAMPGIIRMFFSLSDKGLRGEEATLHFGVA
jgi:hypothetical protein